MSDGILSRIKLSPKHLLVGVFVFLLLLSFFTSIIVSQKPQLQAAKALWESQNINDYRVVVDVGIPLSEIGTYFITVRDGEIVEAEFRSGIWFLAPDSEYANLRPVPFERASQYTVDAIFELAEDMLAYEPYVELTTRCERHSLDFDNRYGYIKSLDSDCSGGFLAWHCAIGDCGFHIGVTEFQVIPDGE